VAIPDGQRVAGMDADSDPITVVMIEAWAGAYDQDGYLVDDAGAQVWEPIVFPRSAASPRRADRSERGRDHDPQRCGPVERGRHDRP
jgi:hypothetical protein